MPRPPRLRFSQSHCPHEGDDTDDDTDDAGCDFAFEHAYHAKDEIDDEKGGRRPPCCCADSAGKEVGAADQPTCYRQNAEDSVDRFSPLLGPVDVLQVKPQGELVEREADAYPEDRGGDIERCSTWCCGHQDDSCADDDKYPENLVVNMNTGDLEVA